MIINMPTKNFKALVSIIKSMKCNNICVSGNMIYGSDPDFYVIKRIILSEPFPVSLSCYMADLEQFTKTIVEAGFEEIYIDTIFNKIYVDCIAFNQNIPVIANELINKFAVINNIISHNPDYSCSDLLQNINFSNILELKAGDGVRMLNIENKYFIALYNSLIPVNKSDKVSINIYDLGSQFVSYFTVKKSKCIIEVFIKCLKM